MPDRRIYKGDTPVPGVEGGNIDILGFVCLFFYGVQVFLNRSRGMSTREEGVSPDSPVLGVGAFGNGASPWSGSGSLIGNPV